MYSLSKIAEITGAERAGGSDHEITSFMYDSRSAQSPVGTLFIAFVSDRNNAHQFIPDLISRGFRSFLVKRSEVQPADFPADVTFLITGDPLSALQALAAHHRLRFYIPVIGITGSNGKTVVKEWLYQLLKSRYSICRSPRSYNSQIGVPLSVLNLRQYHTLAIFEAGISRPGEMAGLEKIIRPTLGVFSSFGTAHDEGFKDGREKLKEKFLLLKDSKFNVIHHSVPLPDFLIDGKSVRIGGNGADWSVSAEGNRVSLKSQKDELAFEIPFNDNASLKNAATCAVVLKSLGLSDDYIVTGMKDLQSVALRLEIKNGIHRSVLINDYYNSDLESLSIALDHLKQKGRNRKKAVIVSDIEQSGLQEADLYRRVSELLLEASPELLIGIGKRISANAAFFKGETLFFNDTGHFLSSIKEVELKIADATILLKGARSFDFDKISRRLQQKSHDTVFEIDLNRLRANVNYYRSLIQPEVQMMCMVKAMGYGSGGAEIARSLQHIGVNYLAVAYADEGVELREAMITLPVMVMNPEEGAFEDIILHQLEPELYSFAVLEAFAGKLDAAGIAEPYPVHLKIDTGMRRLGFSEHEVPLLLAALKRSPHLKIQSVFSHLSASEDPAHDPFTAEQLQVFTRVCDAIEKQLGYKVLRHICNSAGITRFPEAHMNMVRLGIGMYGVGSSPLEQGQLLPVGTLKTRVSQIRHLKAGVTVGYGRKGLLESDASVAVIPLGYADGFLRMLGNGTHGVYIAGKFCRTVGNICMDMCMIDVTGVGCAEGDEVIIFSDFNQLQGVARALHTISYEVLTNVSARVKRVYTEE